MDLDKGKVFVLPTRLGLSIRCQLSAKASRTIMNGTIKHKLFRVRKSKMDG